MIEGLVSTVIPVYNRSAMLREAVDSVLAQSWPVKEIIIVDDGSSDDTPAVAEQLRQQYPEIIRVVRQQNGGPGAARQAGFIASRGEFVQFLDSDDLLLPSKFEIQVKGLKADSIAGISYGRTYTRVNGDRLPMPAQRTGERHRDIFPRLLTGRIWETSTALYRRSAMDKIGPWPCKKQLEDWEFDGKAGAEGIKLHYCDEYVAEYRNHDEPRLCHLWLSDPDAMNDRASAFVAMLGHAQRAGVARDSAEMAEFVRTLFWEARNAGASGMTANAQQLFELARTNAVSPGWDYRLVGIAAACLGWRRVGRLSESLERWRA